MKNNIQILIVDDHELVRHGLQHMLELEADIEIVGDCASAEEALSQVELRTPDIVLMDVRMHRTGGIEACRQIKEKHPRCGIIMLTGYDAYLPQAIEAGAAGYLLKNVRRVDLVKAIRQVYQLRNRHEDRDTSGAFKEVQLVVLQPDNTSKLLRFVDQLGEILHDNYARITHTVGSWDRGTVITVQLQPNRFPSVLDKLANIPEVEKVEEETLAKDAFPKPIGMLARTSNGPWKRILVSLRC